MTVPPDTRALWVPVGKGVRQDLDPTARPIDVPVALEDGLLDKGGRFTTRGGFHRLARNTDNGGTSTDGTLDNARALLSTGGPDAELCVVGDAFLYGRVERLAKWEDRGPVSPFKLRQTPIFQDEQAYPCQDMAEEAGYVMYAAKRIHRDDSDSTFTRELAYTVKTVDGETVTGPRFENPTTATDEIYHAVRCASTDGLLVVFAMQETDATPSLLDAWHWSTVNPGDNAWTSLGTLTSNILYIGEDERAYDAIRLASGSLLLAVVDDTNQEIILTEYDSTMAAVSGQTYTMSTHDPYVRVALAEDPDNDQYLVLTASQGSVGDPATQAVVRIYGVDRDLAAGTENYATTLATLTAGISTAQNAHDLGVAYDAENDLAVCVWSRTESGGVYENDTALMNRSVTASSGATADVAETTYNCRAVSRPWIENGRAYVAAATLQGHSYLSDTIFQILGANPGTPGTYADPWGVIGRNGASPWDNNIVLDLRAAENNTGARRPYLCGNYDVGRAVNVPAPKGSANNVVRLPDYDKDPSGNTASKRYRWMCGSSARNQNGSVETVASMEMRADYAAPVTYASVLGGAVAISGGYISWYDGKRCYELGHTIAPLVYESAAATTGGALADGTYHYVPVWYWTDGRNLVHRSVPGPPAEEVLSGGGGSGNNTLAIRVNPATNRIDYEQVSAVIFRGDSDGVYKRLSTPDRLLPNIDTDYKTEDFDDDGGYVRQEIVYTGSGELPAFCPEGAGVVQTVNGRLWLGDMVRFFLVQFSKPPDPGLAGAYGLAPEFAAEGFAVDIERDREVTGLAALDDKLVLFTRSSAYLIAGRGPLDNGADNDLSDLSLINADRGCIDPRSVVTFPGGVMFQGDSGIEMYDRGRSWSFIGAGVEDDTAAFPIITSATHDRGRQLVLFTCLNADKDAGIVLVFDYEAGAWIRWNPRRAGGARIAPVGGCMHKGAYHIVEADGYVWQQQSTGEVAFYDDGTEWVSLAVEFADVFGGQPGGWQRISRFVPVIERYETTGATVGISARMIRDGAEDPLKEIGANQVDQMEGTKTPLEIRPHRQKCHSMRLRIESTEGPGASTGQGFAVSGVLVHVRPRQTAARVVGAQRV